MGQIGTNLVLRGFDEAALAAAGDEVRALVRPWRRTGRQRGGLEMSDVIAEIAGRRRSLMSSGTGWPSGTFPAVSPRRSPSRLDLADRQDARGRRESASDRAFIGGADVNDLCAVETPAEGERLIRNLQQMIAAYCDLPMPVIAAIDGPRIGAGMEFVAACDIRIVAPRGFRHAGNQTWHPVGDRGGLVATPAGLGTDLVDVADRRRH